jgi:hypothetical protein
MKKNKYEILERPDGAYYVVGATEGMCYGPDGPYSTIDEAEENVPDGDLQYPLFLNLKNRDIGG